MLKIKWNYTCSTTGCPKITDFGFVYSPRGETTEVWESTPHSAGYYHATAGYWANGALNTLGMAGIPNISYGADSEGRASTVSAASGQNPVTATSYNPASQVTRVTFGSGDSDVFAFDANTGRMTQYTYNVNGQSETGVLTWNPNASLGGLQVTDPFNNSNTQTCTYAHDDLSRLQTAGCGSAWSQTFTYDPFGNISKTGSSGYTANYVLGNGSTNNQIQSVGGINVSYDAYGNISRDSYHSYTWDAEGKALSIDTTGLTYDALGRMAEQNQGETYYQIVYSPMGSKMAVMKAQTVQQAFVPLPGGATAEYLSWGLSHYRHPDWLGSSRLESGTARNIIQDVAYAPFGEPYAQNAGGNGELSFTGQNKDTDWLNYDFMYREHDPRAGRWISPDPAGMAAADPADPQTWNRYAYVGNRPLNTTDPLGLFDQTCDPFTDPFLCGSYCPPEFESCGDPGCDPVIFGCDPGSGGGGGGGGGRGRPSGPPTSPPPQRTGGVYANNETLGLPPGINFPALSLGNLLGLNPKGPCDFGVCAPVGNGFAQAAIPAFICLTAPVCAAAVGVASIVLAGVAIYAHTHAHTQAQTQNPVSNLQGCTLDFQHELPNGAKSCAYLCKGWAGSHVTTVCQAHQSCKAIIPVGVAVNSQTACE